MKSRLARLVRQLLHVEGSPHQTALAFAIGVWIAFFPVLGVHTAMALGIAYAFRLSRVAILVGIFVNNPWTIAPLYTAGTLVGCALLTVPPEGLVKVDWSLKGSAFYQGLVDNLAPYVWPFVLGNIVLGSVGSLLGYMLLRSYLERRQASVTRVEAGETAAE